MEEANRMVTLVDPRFCSAGSTTALTVKLWKGLCKSSLYKFVDASGDLVFKVVKGGSFSLMSRQLLVLDVTNYPVATLFHHKVIMGMAGVQREQTLVMKTSFPRSRMSSKDWL